MKTLRLLSAISFSALALTAASNAFADCSTMNDAEWNSLSASMAKAYDAGNYEEALGYGKRLSVICNRSPIVNYTMSEIYRKSGNEEESNKYAKRATEFINEYPVPQALTERIWLRYAENELPYKKQLADLQGRMTKMAGDLRECSEMKGKYDESAQTLHEHEIRNIYLQRESKANWWGAMWAGVGIAAAGIGMTIAGSVLVVKADKIESSGEMSADKSGFAITKPYVAGWTLLGAGVVATIGGTVLTGIAGYHYNSIDVDMDDDGEKDESLSFNIAPSYVSFGMTF